MCISSPVSRICATAVLFVATLAFSPTSSAALVHWGTTALTQSPGLPVIDDNYMGSSADAVASSALGSAEAHATLVGNGSINTNLNTAVLRGRADASADSPVVALALALEGYQYTGMAPTQISVDFQLTGTIDNAAGTGVNDLTGQASFFTEASLDPFNTLSPLTLFSCGCAFPFAQATTFLTNSGTATDSATAVLDLAPLETFYIFSVLQLRADDNGSAESLNSLAYSFSDQADLISIGTPAIIPVPAAVWLFASALFGLLFTRRRAV